MDGVSRPSGAGITIKLDGKDVILPGLGLQDFGLIENHLLAKRKNPVVTALEAAEQMGLDQDRTDRLVERALKVAARNNKVEGEEVREWMDTRDGLAFTIWIALDKVYPGKYTLEQMNKIIEDTFLKDGEEAIQELIRRRDIASGLDMLGNSTGPTNSQADAKNVAAVVPVKAVAGT